jgi:hypothetical protein
MDYEKVQAKWKRDFVKWNSEQERIWHLLHQSLENGEESAWEKMHPLLLRKMKRNCGEDNLFLSGNFIRAINNTFGSMPELIEGNDRKIFINAAWKAFNGRKELWTPLLSIVRRTYKCHQKRMYRNCGLCFFDVEEIDEIEEGRKEVSTQTDPTHHLFSLAPIILIVSFYIVSKICA